MHTFEENFFTELAGKISAATKLELDALLTSKPKAVQGSQNNDTTTKDPFPASLNERPVDEIRPPAEEKAPPPPKVEPYLANLRTDPLGHNLESVLREEPNSIVYKK